MFERQRRIVLSAGMIACRGRVQREGEVIHVVAEQLTDLSDLLAQRRDGATSRSRHARPRRSGDARRGAGLRASRIGRKPRDIYTPDIQIDTLKVKTRNFR